MIATLISDEQGESITLDSSSSFWDNCPYTNEGPFVFQPKIEHYDNNDNHSAMLRWGGGVTPTRFFQAPHVDAYPNPSLRPYNYNLTDSVLDEAKIAVHKAWKPDDKKNKVSKTKEKFRNLFLRITVKKGLPNEAWIIRHAKFVTLDSTYIPDEEKEFMMDAHTDDGKRYKRNLVDYVVERVTTYMKNNSE